MLFGDLPRINSVGILTAQNPEGEKASKDFNKEANRQLWDMLRAYNYGPIRVKGKFFGTDEDSFLVPNISRDDMIDLGRRFNQAAVIWGEKRADKRDQPYFRFEYIEDGKVQSVRSVHVGSEDVQKRPDMYTMVKGRKFIIPFFQDPHARKVPGKKYGTIADVPGPDDADELAKRVETFFIPFFDDPENTQLEFDGLRSEVSYYSDRLANCPYVKELVDEIRRLEERLLVEDKSHRYYWQNRGVLLECMDKLRCL
jgi:hypothetical protein